MCHFTQNSSTATLHSNAKPETKAWTLLDATNRDASLLAIVHCEAEIGMLDAIQTYLCHKRIMKKWIRSLIVIFSIFSTSLTFAQSQSQLLAADNTFTLPDMWQGSANAPVTIIEYSSLTCAQCAQFHSVTYPYLKANYIDTGKVRYVQREFPFDPIATAAAMLARCYGTNRNAMVEYLYNQQANWAVVNNPLDALANLAKQGGIEKTTFEACLKDKELYEKIMKTQETGRLFGINAAPTFYINGKKITGTLSPQEIAAEINAIIGGSPAPYQAPQQSAPSYQAQQEEPSRAATEPTITIRDCGYAIQQRFDIQATTNQYGGKVLGRELSQLQHIKNTRPGSDPREYNWMGFRNEDFGNNIVVSFRGIMEIDVERHLPEGNEQYLNLQKGRPVGRSKLYNYYFCIVSPDAKSIIGVQMGANQ